TRSVKVPPTSMPMRYVAPTLTLPRKRWTGLACGGDKSIREVGGGRGAVAFRRLAPTAAAAGLEDKPVARTDREAGLLGLDRTRLVVAGIERIAVRRAVFAAEDAA